jgi:hypothetical protein
MWLGICYKVCLHFNRGRAQISYNLALPVRLRSLFNAIVQALRAKGLPLRPSNFTPSNIQQLFPSTHTLRPHALTSALFPHLRRQIHTPFSLSAYNTLSYPLELGRQECRAKRLVSSIDIKFPEFVNQLAVVSGPRENQRSKGSCAG